MPPDAKEMDVFREFLPAFYEQAGIAKIWESAQSARPAATRAPPGAGRVPPPSSFAGTVEVDQVAQC